MQGTSVGMERSIARCRVFLSLIGLIAAYVDPTPPTLTRWIQLGGGAFTLSPYAVLVFVAHLLYSLALLFELGRRAIPSARLATLATWGDVLFAVTIALVTEGITSPFYSFFAFAVLAAGLRSGLRAALAVTGLSVILYTLIIVVAAPINPADHVDYIVMRATYIAITGYLVGYLGQERINQEARIGHLEADAQRERIARSLHDGYAQSLAGVNLRLASCHELFRRGRHDEALTELIDLQVGVNREHDDLREYIRSLVDLEVTHAPQQAPDAVRVAVQVDFGGPAAFVEHVLLILLEGTRNVRRHAHARSAMVSARTEAEELVLAIDDDGGGFADGAAAPWSMVSRVSECGGRLTLGNNSRGGAHVLIRLPAA